MDERNKYNLTIRDIMRFACDPAWNLSPEVSFDSLFSEDSPWFLDIHRAAEKFRVGPAVMMAWITSDLIEAYRIHDVYYSPFNAEPKKNMFSVIQ